MIYLDVFGELQQLFLQFCVGLHVVLHLRLESDSLLSQSTAFLFQCYDLFIRVFLLEFTVVLRHPDRSEEGFGQTRLDKGLIDSQQLKDGCSSQSYHVASDGHSFAEEMNSNVVWNETRASK